MQNLVYMIGMLALQSIFDEFYMAKQPHEVNYAVKQRFYECASE